MSGLYNAVTTDWTTKCLTTKLPNINTITTTSAICWTAPLRRAAKSARRCWAALQTPLHLSLIHILPAGIVSLDGVTNVTLDFDTSEMTSTKLNVSNIRAINVPSNYELQILSSIVSGVTLYGPADEIEKLSADSIVAQIDCQSLNLTVGQQTIAVSIQIPSSSRIFATGSYTVQCEVTSK